MPTDPAKNVTGNSENFTNFMRRLIQVPHSEIKAALDAEKAAKRIPKSAWQIFLELKGLGGTMAQMGLAWMAPHSLK